MREIRPSGSEGGGVELNQLSLPLSHLSIENCTATGAGRILFERHNFTPSGAIGNDRKRAPTA
jgi:hypothetical protein